VSWQTVKLGDVCKVIAGQSPEGKYYNNDGNGIPFYQGKKDFGNVYIKPPTVWTTEVRKEAIKDDILMSVRAPVGPVNISRENICIGRGLAAIRATEKIDKSYLFKFLLSIEKDLVGSSGAVFNSINKGQIENLEIPFPPLATQQKIVTKLDAIFAEIDKATAAAEANAKNAEILFQSYLTEVFESKDENFVSKNIGDVCTLRSGTTVNSNLEKTEGELPYLKVADMNLIFNQNSIKTSSRFLNKSDVNKNSIIRKGSTIFPKRGGAIDTNKKRITEIDIAVDLNIMSAYPKEILNPFILYYFFLGLDMRKLGSGASIRQINNYDIEPLVINFPKNLDKQAELVNVISNLKNSTEQLYLKYKAKKFSLYLFRKAILKQAFNGELVKE
jgi:type I restriction enzyme S subunit